MITDLTEYIRCLGPGGEPPDLAEYEDARTLLRIELVREMKRRGLWSAPPRFLGLPGDYWSKDLLDELVFDCYVELFLRRLGSLKNQLLVRPDVNGLIIRGVRNFLHDLRRANDPLGFQIYELLSASLGRLRDRGTLRLLGGEGRKIDNGTVCVFGSQSLPVAVPKVDLGPHVRVWNGDLWPELITAHGRGRRRVLDRLDAHLASLPEAGVEVFRFKDLVEPMKSDLRGRWHDEIAVLAEEMMSRHDPDLNYRQLHDCVVTKLQEESPADREQLLKLFRFFWHFAAGRGDSDVAAKADKGGKPPTELGLAKELEIPRHRIAGFRQTLGRHVQDCLRVSSRRRESGPAPAVSGIGAVSSTRGEASSGVRRPAAGSSDDGSTGAGPLNEISMTNPTDRPQDLRLASAEAAARWASARAELDGDPGPPAPGDLFVIATAGDLLVEWLVLERDATAARLLVVPADDHPATGSRDVALDPGATGGLANIRCAFAAWLETEAFDPALRTGRLAPEVLEQARRKRAAVADRAMTATLLERMVDEDPEVEGRMAELAEVVALLEAEGPRTAGELPRGSARRDRAPSIGRADGSRLGRRRFAVAASILLSFGLGGGAVWMLRHLVLPGPGPDTPEPRVKPFGLTLSEPVRSRDEPFVVPADLDLVVWTLQISPRREPFQRFRVALRQQHTSEVIWETREPTLSPSEMHFGVPRGRFADGGYRFHVYGLAEASDPELVADYSFWIKVER